MSFVNCLKPEIQSKGLSWEKCVKWFSGDRKFIIDDYVESLGCSDTYWEIFSLDKSIAAIQKEFKSKGLVDELKCLKWWCRNTIIGMRKYCEESDGIWRDPVKGDNVYRMSWFHYVVTNELEHAVQDWLNGNMGATVLLSIPPQHCKTTLIAGGLAPLMMGLRPESKGIIATYSNNFGAEILRRDTMRVVESIGYARLFGKVFQSSMTEEDKKKLSRQGVKKLANNANRKVTLKGGSLLGCGIKQATGNDANFIIVDDPIKNMEVARSDTEVTKITEEFNASAGSRIRNGTFMAVVHTRWRYNDVIGDIISRRQMMTDEERSKDKIINLVFRAWYDPTDNFSFDFRVRKGDLLWEEISGKAYIKAKYSDSLTKNSLYNQKPLDENSSKIKKSWLKRYNPSLIETLEFDKIIISVDTSYNDTKSSDKCAIGVYGLHEGSYYLIYLYYDVCSFYDTLYKLEEILHKFPKYHAILIETKANGKAVYEVISKKYSKVIEICPTESKKARLLAVSPIIESGRLFMPDNSDGDEVVEQIVNFKGIGKKEKDDLVDITTQCLRYCDDLFNIGGFDPSNVKFFENPNTKFIKNTVTKRYNKSRSSKYLGKL